MRGTCWVPALSDPAAVPEGRSWDLCVFSWHVVPWRCKLPIKLIAAAAIFERKQGQLLG